MFIAQHSHIPEPPIVTSPLVISITLTGRIFWIHTALGSNPAAEYDLIYPCDHDTVDPFGMSAHPVRIVRIRVCGEGPESGLPVGVLHHTAVCTGDHFALPDWRLSKFFA